MESHMQKHVNTAYAYYKNTSWKILKQVDLPQTEYLQWHIVPAHQLFSHMSKVGACKLTDLPVVASMKVTARALAL